MIAINESKASLDFGLEFVNITFSICDTEEDLSNYQFDLVRANDLSDTFIPVHSNIRDFECNDYSVNLLNPEIRYYYKVRVHYLPSDVSFDSDAFTYQSVKTDRYSSYMTHVYSMYLDVIDNANMVLLKRKRTGRRCDCYDDVRGSRLEDRCEGCFGTGYIGGYYGPKEVKVNYLNAASKQEGVNVRGTFEETSPLQLWTTNYPLIQENDVLIDTLTCVRYVVVNWQPSYKSGFLIRQTIQVTKLPESSKLYKLPI